MGFKIIAAVLAFSPAIAFATTGGPMFTDTFDGVVKDTARWEERTTEGATITQNNDLTLLRGAGGSGEYTTRTIKIPVGGFARGDIRVHQIAPFASGILSLSTNTSGTTFPSFNDSYKLGLQFYNSAVLTSYGNSSSDTGQSHPHSWPDDTPATVEIERFSASVANYRVYDSSGGQVFFYSMNVPTFTGDLYVTLTGPGNGVVRWDNVAVPLSSVPEPTSLAAVMLTATTLLRRRRRRN